MIVAHVLSSFGLGGQERVALELARLQQRAGHEVHALSIAPLPEGPLAQAFRSVGVRTTTIQKRGRVDPSLPLRLVAYLLRHRVAVVHTHNPHALIYGAPAARLAGAVAVHSRHGLNPDTPRRLWLARMAARLVDTYVAVTPSLARAAVARRDCDASRLRVVSNGIDLSRFAPNPRARRAMRRELGIPDDAWVVGSVGRLAREKAHGALLDAMAPLLGEARRLVIVGDGEERAELRARIARMEGRAYVHMLGERSDVETLLAGFDVFALTSVTEGLPLVLLEAMATGLPVVSTAVGGIPDLVEHRVTGLLAPPGQRGPLTRQLDWLSMDGSLSRQIGEAGRREVLARHSVERMAEAYGEVYEQALARHPSMPVGVAVGP